ncbi:MAG: hypothetical protein Q9198_001058 [Flavoplaca austrocitrina]
MDVYPCVTDEESWMPGVSIETLFGHLCTGNVFLHDHEMRSIRDIGTVPRPKSGTQRSPCKRGESATPRSPHIAPRSKSRSLSGQSASGRSALVISKILGENLGYDLSNKSRGSTGVNTPWTHRVKSRTTSRERSERQVSGELISSFSGWLDPQDGEPKPSPQTTSETIDKEFVNAIIKTERNIPPDEARPGTTIGEAGTSPIDRSHQHQGQSNPLEVAHDIYVQNEDASYRLRYHDGTTTRRRQPLPSGTGTEDNPVALSESEIDWDADKGDETQLLGSVDGLYDLKSQSGSSVSVADSMFDSQVVSLSNSHTERSTDSHRIRYRKEIYKALQRDDGHIWGREYSLVSTRSSRDPDDLEL